MKRIIQTSVVPFFVILFFCSSIDGQDLHYSQFYNSPININPALTGIFNGDKRITASVRDQWRSVPVPWFTISGSYDMKINPERIEKSFFSAGFSFNNDRQGDSKLNLTSLNLSGSYTYLLNTNNVVTVGALIGFGARGFDERSLTWDVQWVNGAFDPSASSQENFDSQRVNYLETGLGLNYRLQKDERTKIDAGVGAYHLIEPTTTFYNTPGKKLPRHFSFNAVGTAKLIDAFDVQLGFLHQMQGEFRETVINGLGKIYVSQKRGKETELHLGLGYRTTKSLFPIIAIQYKEIYASFSYDIDQSDFDLYTDGKGGPEFHFRYIITDVKPLPQLKSCPIF